MAGNKYTSQIVENREVAQKTFLMKLHLLGKKIRPRPGQFLEVSIESAGLLNRPFSVHYFYDDQKHIKFLYKLKGPGTDFLSRKAVGDYLEFWGPFGKGFNLRGKPDKVAIVAGGIGYAPFAFLIKEILKKKKHTGIDVYYGTGSQTEFVEFWRMEDSRLTFFLSTEDGSKGFKGFITDVFKKQVYDLEKMYDRVYTCGNIQMMKKVREICNEMNLPVEGSIERRFGCGFGVCLGCSIKMKNGEMSKVCEDGPVYDLKQIDWSYFDE